jgi:glycosyltransferase involved in cell wall biosynthesis
MPSLLYLSLMRFPTEKAHGLQIMQNCEAFAQAGHAVTLWVTSRRNTPSMAAVLDPFAHYNVEPCFTIQRVPVLDLMPYWRGRLERLAFYLVQATYLISALMMLLRRRDDVYYTRDEWVALLLTLLKPRRCVAYEAHQFKAGRLGGWLQQAVCRRVGSVIAVTRPLADDLIAHGADPSAVLVAHDGVRAARFADLPTRGEARAVLGWPQDAFIVGYLGRLTTLNMEKGVGALVDALAQVEGAALAIVGGPDDAAEAYRRRWLAHGLPSERFLYVGSVPPAQVPTSLCAFDVAAMPFPPQRHYARYASPLKLFEYMAAGAAIVASDLPSCADVLRHEENALLVPPDDTAALAAAVQRLKDDPSLRARLGQAARRQALQHHTWQARAHTILMHLYRWR